MRRSHEETKVFMLNHINKFRRWQTQLLINNCIDDFDDDNYDHTELRIELFEYLEHSACVSDEEFVNNYSEMVYEAQDLLPLEDYVNANI